MVDGDEFKALLKFIETGDKVHMIIAQVVCHQYEDAKVALKQKLKDDALSLAIRADIWTSCTKDVLMLCLWCLHTI